MGLICLFFPSIIFCYIKWRKTKKGEINTFSCGIKILIQYIYGCIIINGIILLIRTFIQHKNDNVYYNLNNYSAFATKYLILAMLLAILIPYIEEYCKNHVALSCSKECHINVSTKVKDTLVILHAIFCSLHHFIRMFDNSIWGDEGLVVLASRKTLTDMIESVANSGHTPLHYFVAWICVKLLGEHGVVYHFSATLPYFLIIIIAVSFIRKVFGRKTAVIFITLCSFLECAITYNLEIRMYAWCQFFILMAYLMAYRAYTTGKVRHYLLMAVFAAGAVYSHYFALASMALIYLVLLIYNVIKCHRNIWKVIASGILTLALIAPWFIYTRRISGKVMSDYGIAEVPFRTCVEFIFHSKYSWMLLISFIIATIIALAYDSNIISFTTAKNDQRKFFINFNLRGIQLEANWVWMISGIIAVFGTIIAAEVISYLFFPIIVLRYLYVSYIIIWLLFAIVVSKLKFKNIWTLLLVAFVLLTCYSTCINTITTELSNNRRLEHTLAATKSEIDENDFIYTDYVHFAWTVEQSYYPKTPNNLLGHPEWWGVSELPKLDHSVTYWLFLSAPISEDITDNLTNQSRQAELVVDDGYLGVGDVWIYKIVDADK